uniref:ORF3 n=1 Tax=Torque teno Leptonychotes weddellii virus-1 TaxID=2012676 RepID=A0A1Z2RVQ4_9VIRU|nr:ORF3 [Torque teno Leptonychotes weddellii virus 1]ASA48971.1 ORF3 [Torque teno Leptonychotes weddellii virus 1]
MTSSRETSTRRRLTDRAWGKNGRREQTSQPQGHRPPEKGPQTKPSQKQRAGGGQKGKAGQGGKKNFTGATRGSRGGRAPP